MKAMKVKWLLTLVITDNVPKDAKPLSERKIMELLPGLFLDELDGDRVTEGRPWLTKVVQRSEEAVK
jgi:hypothetical protein